MTPDKTRKAKERRNRKNDCLVRVEVYVKPEDRQAIRDLADKLTGKRLTKAK